MPEPSTLLLFLGSAMVLFVLPGPAVLYIVTRSLSQGTAAGLVSVAGIHAGSLVHITASILGLTAILAASAVAFTVVRICGGIYLVYLGVRAIRGGDPSHRPSRLQPAGYRRIFWQGMVVNVLNPKTALFFLAFVPQFVDPARGGVATQLAILGVVFVAAGMVSDSTYALLSGIMGSRLLGRPGWQSAERWVPGSIYLSLGAAALASAGPES